MNLVIENIVYTTAEEFVSALQASNGRWQPEPAHWIFRGQSNAEWPLVPKALRIGVALSYGLRGPTTPLASKTDQITAEFELLRAFMLVADRQGLALPEDGHIMRTPEGWKEIIGPALRGAMSGTLPWPPPALLSVLALAQHYGVPTRLLDWSERPWVAAYFAAVEAARAIASKERTTGSLVVWALNQRYVLERWNVSDVEVLLVTAPRATNPNLQAQAGLFTVHRSTDAETDREPLDVVIDRAGRQDPAVGSTRTARFPLMRKLVLPMSEAPTLLRLLHYEGIDGASMYPGLGGVVTSLREKRLWDEHWTHPWGELHDPHGQAYFGS